MAAMVPAGGGSALVHFDPVLDADPPAPGMDMLWAIDHAAAECGARVWTLGKLLDGQPLLAPHPTRWRLDESTRTWTEDLSWREMGAALVGARVMLALEMGSDVGRPGWRLAREAMTSQDHNTMRALVTALAEDLAGVARVDLADAFDLNRHSNAVGKSVKRGRVLWAALGAWPWAYLPAPHLPDDGWTDDPELLAVWRRWRRS